MVSFEAPREGASAWDGMIIQKTNEKLCRTLLIKGIRRQDATSGSAARIAVKESDVCLAILSRRAC